MMGLYGEFFLFSDFSAKWAEPLARALLSHCIPNPNPEITKLSFISSTIEQRERQSQLGRILLMGSLKPR